MIVRLEKVIGKPKQVKLKNAEGVETAQTVPTFEVRFSDKTGRLDSTIPVDDKVLNLFGNHNIIYRNCKLTKKGGIEIGKEVACNGW